MSETEMLVKFFTVDGEINARKIFIGAQNCINLRVGERK
jgi:hypothetical protein